MKIAVFGGAFDPPHLGHINLVKSVCNVIKPDKTFIIPTGNAPHKSTITNFADRFKLSQSAFINCPNCEISDIENSSGINYTIDTVRKLKTKHPPGSQLVLIIGSDMLINFDKWKDYKQILELCTVVAAARDRKTGYTESANRFGIELLDIPIMPMSSSQIRDKFSAKRYTHSINVAIMCGKLSKEHGLSPEMSEKTYIAGILHDIMKENPLPSTEFALDFEKFAEFNPAPIEISEPKLWHAIAGAKYVRDEMGITDTDIINAIRFHTIGRENMNEVEKIVYIADKISAERKYYAVEELRALAFDNLDSAIHKEIQLKRKKLLLED